MIGSVGPLRSSVSNRGASSGEMPRRPVRSLLGSSRQRVRVQRRETLGWPVLLSLALHLAFVLFLLMAPSTPPAIDVADAPSWDVVAKEGPAEGSPEPPGPAETSAGPIAPAVPDQQAETMPAPTAPTPVPPPPVQQAEVPPPAPTPAPDTPPPPKPVQQADIPLPTPPAPPPVPRPIPPVAPRAAVPVAARPLEAPAHRPPASPQRVAARPATGRASVNPAGAQAHGTDGQNAAGSASNASNGAAWMGKLKQWWDQHAFYPKEASQTNEGGNVKAHIVIAPDGQVISIEVVQGSGSSVLDAAAVAVFRSAHLPPFPPGTPAQPADVVVTLHYRPADSGG